MKNAVDIAILLVREVVSGYDYNPGDSDLDDEQPIHVGITLGAYRRFRLLLYELEKNNDDE